MKQEIEQKKLMSRLHKKVPTTLNYVWKRGRDRAMLLFPNVNKTLIGLRNPFARYRSTTSPQLTFLRISWNKPLNKQKLKEPKTSLGGYFFYHSNKNYVSTVCQYPIVPEPHCFTYPNSALRDNPKPNACKIFKEMVNTEAPQNSNTVNADGIFLIQSTLGCLNYSIFVQKVVLSVLWFMLWCLRISTKNTKRHKKEERRNEQSDCVFYIDPKTKMQTGMYDLL